MTRSVYLDIDSGDKADLCRLLGVCLSNGVPIIDALQAVGDCARNPRLREATISMASWIQSGDVLTSPKLFEVYPEFDDGFFRSYISAGERMGEVEACLPTLAALYDGMRKGSPRCLIEDSEPLAMFLSVWRHLWNTGCPILLCWKTCLTVIEQRKFPLMAEGIRAAIEDIERGDCVSEAFIRHPNRFPEQLVSLMRLGEMAGAIDGILDKIVIS